MSPYFKAGCLRFQVEGVSSTSCHSYAGINTLKPCFTVHFVESSYNCRKEREFEETMDSLQNDIDSLESERGELKDKVKQMSKKVLIQGLTKSHSISDGKPSHHQTTLTIPSGTYRNNSQCYGSGMIIFGSVFGSYFSVGFGSGSCFGFCKKIFYYS
jgi:hypothetical protein